MEWVWFIVLFALLCLGFLLTLLMLPGNWLMVLATIAYAALTQWKIIGWKIAAALIALGIAGSVVDILAGIHRRKPGDNEPPPRVFVGMLIKIALAGIVFIVGTFLGFPGKRRM